MAGLPEGFTIDQSDEGGPSGLPEGFTIDKPQERPGFAQQAWDFVKQIPQGMAEAASSPAALLPRMGRAAVEMENMSGVSPEETKRRFDEMQATGQKALTPATTPGGRMGRAVGSAVVESLPLTPMSSPLQGGIAALGQGVEEATGSPAAGIATELGAAGLPGIYRGARRMLGRAFDYHGAPLLEELERSHNARYGEARALGVQLNPTKVSEGIKDIRKTATPISEDNAPIAHGIMAKAEAEHAPIPREKGTTAEQRAGLAPLSEKETVDFDKIDSLRRDLGETAKKGGSEGAAARDFQRGIDDFLTNAHQTGAVVAGDGQALARIAREARGDAAATARLKSIYALRERAEEQASTTGNVEKAFRNQLKNFVRPYQKQKGTSSVMSSPARDAGFNSAEIEELRQAAHTGTMMHVLRSIGIAGGYLGALGLGGYTAWHGEDPRSWKGAGTAALGLGARLMHGRIMRTNLDRATRMMASRSPWAQERGIRPSPLGGAPGTVLPALRYPLVTGSNAIQDAGGFKKGGRVTRTFRIKA